MKDINLLRWLVLIAFAVPLLLTHISRSQALNQDFRQLYSVGRILNEHSAEKLYDYQLQQRTFNELQPMSEGALYGPSPYPPFVALFFRPFASLPYFWAYLLWICISATLYIAGTLILGARYFPEDAVRRSLLCCLAIAFYPFLMATFLTGQLSAVGFFAMSLGIAEDDKARPFPSGLALSICLYKPTLLLVILPMLLLTKRLRTLAGIAAGGLCLALLATAFEGIRVWSGYLDLLLYFGRIHALLHLPLYMDVWAFLSLFPWKGWPVTAVVWASAACAAVCLLLVWRMSIGAGRAVNRLMWAATITWTTLLNVYFPIWDSVLLVISIVITVSVLKNVAPRLLGLLIVLLFVGSWITLPLAEHTRVQIFTIFAAIFGTVQLVWCRRV